VEKNQSINNMLLLQYLLLFCKQGLNFNYQINRFFIRKNKHFKFRSMYPLVNFGLWASGLEFISNCWNVKKHQNLNNGFI
jgi:hypothetical protein